MEKIKSYNEWRVRKYGQTVMDVAALAEDYANDVADAKLKEVLKEIDEELLKNRTARVNIAMTRLLIKEILATLNGETNGELIVCDPEIQGGIPTVKGTRIPTQTISEMYKAGETIGVISKAYQITPDQVIACVLYDFKQDARIKEVLDNLTTIKEALEDSRPDDAWFEIKNLIATINGENK